ncbi:MAG: GDP-mannose 4,6-dehydratase [Chloroflexi bacterium]|nr:GDP-mannose 4,6-dehydratase [Chloroflexota bacterium]MCY3582199.1 GDP-mannose 4,6-dehydratase [Chloroflexota bacterium]MCY3715855.1 GDP-mannose 4,6-dehydratase [Chloroflexota bacterium]MDE2649915.1 GDP-mannose 4,6-dehydratase [Chloroflexota bacterium]MXX82332.1 NAD-dependent epimerase/dehydratase family protein [Chloroflexota bacterium]
MRALITGGAGFIGSHLAERLLRQGYQVTIIDNLSTGRLENIQLLESQANYRYAVEDIRNIHVIDRLVSECDIIFHLAAVVGVRNIVDHPINTIEVNIGGTEVILKTAARYRRRLMLASTSEVYGKGVNFPFREDDDTLSGPTLRSRWSYAASKAIDEFLAFAYHAEVDLPVTLFRLFNTVGPRQVGQYGMVVPRFVRWALANQPIQVYGDGQQQRCFGNVYDVVAAIQGLAETDSAIGELYNIGSREEISILQLAQRIRDRADSASEIRLVPYEQAYQQAGFEDFRRRVPSIDKIQQAIGWQPTTPLDATIDQIIACFQEQMR